MQRAEGLRPATVFGYPSLEPFLNQAKDPRIGNPKSFNASKK